MSSSSYGEPILIGATGDAQVLEAASLRRDGAADYSEDWLPLRVGKEAR